MSPQYRVLFIHGFMGSALNWGRIRMLLESKINGVATFALDLLGHALNHPKNPGAYPSAHSYLTQDLIQQVESFRPTHVVAHSFGLRPALLMAEKRPELIPHLIVEDSAPILSAQAHAFLMKVIHAPTPFRTREEAKLYFETHYGVQSVYSRFFMSNIRSRPDNLADWRFDKSFLEALLNESLSQDLWKEWRKFPGRLELLYGRKEQGLSESLVDKMKIEREGLTVFPFEEAGHWIHSDQPELFVETLAQIIQS